MFQKLLSYRRAAWLPRWMVGHPKRIEDLEKIKAGVRVRCSNCTRERMFDRERLIRELTRRGLSTAWEMLPTHLRCACGSKRVEVLAMPFTSGEEDGEALFEHLLRMLERDQHNPHRPGSADWCKETSDCARDLNAAKVAMRAWIVARSRRY